MYTVPQTEHHSRPLVAQLDHWVIESDKFLYPLFTQENDHHGLEVRVVIICQGNTPRLFKPPKFIVVIGGSPPPYFSLTVPPTATAPQGGAAHDSQTIHECPPPHGGGGGA